MYKSKTKVPNCPKPDENMIRNLRRLIIEQVLFRSVYFAEYESIIKII